MAGEMNWRVGVGGEETSVAFVPGENGPGDVVFVCAHGAGGHMGDRGMLALADVLREKGISVVRFNFLYREKKSNRPDPMPRLETTFAAVVDSVRQRLAPRVLLIGGRSMGGRAATMMAARGFPCAGILLFAYPLHPAGQPDKLRDAHLDSIEVPVLCFNGTRDPLCTPSLMEKALETVRTEWQMEWIEGADHSFHVLKSSGRTDAQVLDLMGDRVRDWVNIVASRTPSA